MVPAKALRNIVLSLYFLASPVFAQEDRTTQERLDDIWMPGYEGELPGIAQLNIRNAVLEEALGDLTYPWAFEFLNENEILLTEISGRLLRYNIGDRVLSEVTGLPDIAGGFDQVGLLDVEVHPQFVDNGRVYFSYVELDPVTKKFFRTAVATAILDGHELKAVRPILQVSPFSWSPSNFGGALEFDGKGYLYVSVGNRSEDWQVSKGDRLEGKILRLNDDGSTPPDNPFVADDSIDDRIWALGVRNPQGLHWDPETGQLLETEHGPMGGDEVNVIEGGKHYGWPDITYGQDYTGDPIGSGTHREGTEQPRFYYLPSRAISPITVYRGEMFPEWDGHLLVGALKGQHVSKLDLDEGTVRSEHIILAGLKSRIRDIKVAGDGSIWVLAQSGSLYRLSREAGQSAEAVPGDTKLIYGLICSGCHESGAYQAPRLSVAQDWGEVLARPREEVYRRSIEGYGLMPPRGLCGMCDDEFMRTLVDEMLEKIGPSSGQGDEN